MNLEFLKTKYCVDKALNAKTMVARSHSSDYNKARADKKNPAAQKFAYLEDKWLEAAKKTISVLQKYYDKDYEIEKRKKELKKKFDEDYKALDRESDLAQKEWKNNPEHKEESKLYSQMYKAREAYLKSLNTSKKS